jgi:hypothetical protein
MAFDSCDYTNSKGQSVNLMSSTIRSNVVELKPFSYTNTQTISTIEEKEFEMVIIVKGKSLANETVDKLMADANQSANGRLIVNTWQLVCRCVGITMIDAQNDDVYRFAARFYSSYPLWTKNELTGVSATGWANRATVISSTPWALSCELGTRIAESNLSFGVYTAQNTADNLITAAFSSYEPTDFSLNWASKYVIASGLTNPISLIPDNCNLFKIYNPGTYYLVINTGFSRGTFQITHLRGMPEW